MAGNFKPSGSSKKKNEQLDTDGQARPLRQAIKDNSMGNVEHTLDIMDRGIDDSIYPGTQDNTTPLQFAIMNGNNEIAELLIDQGADINKPGKEGRTPIVEAVNNSNQEMVDMLIDKGADVNKTVGMYHTTPLHLAASNGDKDITSSLIDAGGNLEVENTSGQTPLYKAAENNHVGIIDEMALGGVDVNYKSSRTNDSGLSALHIAAQNGNYESAELLANNGAKLDDTDRSQQTPLHKAAKNNRSDIIEMLGHKGVNLDATDGAGKTPKQLAGENNKLEAANNLNELQNNNSKLKQAWRSTKHGLTTAFTKAKNAARNIGRTMKHHYKELTEGPKISESLIKEHVQIREIGPTKGKGNMSSKFARGAANYAGKDGGIGR
jgi:ankyrin repeat protein